MSLTNVQRNSANGLSFSLGAAVLSPKNRLYPVLVSPPPGCAKAIPPPAYKPPPWPMWIAASPLACQPVSPSFGKNRSPLGRSSRLLPTGTLTCPPTLHA